MMKYILVSLVAVAGIVMIKLIGCERVQQSEHHVVDLPVDTNFLPIEHKKYNVPTLPFVKKTSGVKLPKGIHERQVKQVIQIALKDRIAFDSANGIMGMKNRLPSTIEIIETRKGEIYVARDSIIENVTVVTFEPPIFQFAFQFGLGCSFGLSENGVRMLPLAIISFGEWNIHGHTLHTPMITIDKDAMGAGVQISLYNNIFAGGGYYRKFSGTTDYKAMIGVMF